MDTQKITETNEEQKDDGYLILKEAEDIIKHNSNRSKWQKFLLFFLLPTLILTLLLFIFSTAFALSRMNSTTILNGISIQGIDVSNLTKEEALNKISLAVNEHISPNIQAYHGEFECEFSPSQLDANFDITSAVDKAYGIGRSDNIFKNNFSILNVLMSGLNINIEVTYDTESLNSIITNINDLLPDKLVNPDYYIDNTSLIITSGTDGYIVDNNKFTYEVLQALSNIRESSRFEIPVKNATASNINIDEIYKNIYKSPTDAYFTTNPYTFYPSSTGLEFDISIDDAKKMLEEKQEQYTIPLKITYPNVSTNDIGFDAFPDQLSSFSTSFKSSNSNRSTNIRLCASKINGVVLMPGETFSFNSTVGKRTPEAGYKEAPAYLNGKTIMDYGGGICQVSSTLYNAVLYSNLEITERYNHGYQPSYVKSGLDATVSWGGPDFKFTNNRNYPIKIMTDTSNKILNIYIYGLKTENDYTVKLEARYLSTIYYSTTYQKDSSLAPGETRTIQSGSNGCKTATYKYLYDKAGNLVSSECISRDTYNPHNAIIAVGE